MAFLNNDSLYDKNSTRVAEVFCNDCRHPFRGRMEKRRTDGEFRYLQFVSEDKDDIPWFECPNCESKNEIDYYYMFAEN